MSQSPLCIGGFTREIKNILLILVLKCYNNGGMEKNMKNYYEILEVDKNASQEVIEKAYRTLAKKYHPDLQQESKKLEYAEKMKKINQAYDVLSNSIKREEYNQELEDERIQNQKMQAEVVSKEQHQRIIQENYVLKQQLNRMVHQNQQEDRGPIGNMGRVFEEQINVARRQAYEDVYIQDMKNKGYKIRYKHDFKYYLKLIKILIIIFLICWVIYQIPFVKNFFIDLYNENIVFQAIVNIFKNTFSAGF